ASTLTRSAVIPTSVAENGVASMPNGLASVAPPTRAASHGRVVRAGFGSLHILRIQALAWSAESARPGEEPYGAARAPRAGGRESLVPRARRSDRRRFRALILAMATWCRAAIRYSVSPGLARYTMRPSSSASPADAPRADVATG